MVLVTFLVGVFRANQEVANGVGGVLTAEENHGCLFQM
jgi:hypothetical protein